MTFYMGAFRAIHISDPVNIRQAIAVQGKQFQDRVEPMMFNSDRVAEGVIMASGDYWKKGRRLVLQAMRDFGMGKELMIVKIDDEIGHLIANLEGKCGQKLRLKTILIESVGNIISQHIFGKRFNEDDPFFIEMLQIMKVLADMPLLANAPYLCFPILASLSRAQMVTAITKARDTVEDYWLNVTLKEHKEDFNIDNIRDFCDLYLAQSGKDGITDAKHFASIMTDMLLAGMETSTTTLNWLFLFLTLHPEVQRKCQQQIDQVIQSDRYAQTRDLDKLTYITAVINETARIGSIVPLSVFHTNLNESQRIGEFDVPPVTMVMYNTYSLHHDKEYWKDPEVFRPERWFDENGDLLSHSDYFMPFGIGPRVCVGELLAKAELFHFSVALLQRFNFKLETSNIDFENTDSGIINNAPFYEISVSKRIIA